MGKASRLGEIVSQDWDNIWISSHIVPDIDSMSSLCILKVFLQWNTKSKIKLIMNKGATVSASHRRFLRMYEGLLGNPYRAPEVWNPKDLMILVDGQLGEGNTHDIKGITGTNCVVIDHHIKTSDIEYLYKDIQEDRCSSSSILFEYTEDLLDKIPVLKDLVYHGMYGDTCGFTVPLTQKDGDIRNLLESQESVNLKIIKYIQGRESEGVEDKTQLVKYLHDYKRRDNYVVAKINACDTNTLGKIADTIASVQNRDMVIVYYEDPLRSEARISVRSPIKELNAHKIIKEITGDLGRGGGHLRACAGYLDLNQIDDVNGYIISKMENMKGGSYV